MDVAEVELPFDKGALRLYDLPLASQLFVRSVFDLEKQGLFIDLRTWRKEGNFHLKVLARLNNTTQRLRHKDFRRILPPELGICIAVVRQLELLCEEHVDVIFWECKLEHFFGKFQTHRVCLSLD